MRVHYPGEPVKVDVKQPKSSQVNLVCQHE
jgi:hypothetical protein